MGAIASTFIKCFPVASEPAAPTWAKGYRGNEKEVEKKQDLEQRIEGLRTLVKDLQAASSGLKPGEGAAHEDPHYNKGSAVITNFNNRYALSSRSLQMMYLNIVKGQGACQRYNAACERCSKHGCACGYLLPDSEAEPIEFHVGDKPIHIDTSYTTQEKTPSDDEKTSNDEEKCEWLQPGSTVLVTKIRGPVSSTDHRVRACVKRTVGEEKVRWFTIGGWDQEGKRMTSECRIAATPVKEEQAEIYAGIASLSKLLQEIRISFDGVHVEFNSTIDNCKVCHTPHWGDSIIALHTNSDSDHKTCKRCAKAWVQKLVKYGANDRCCIQHTCMLPPSNECVESALESKEEASKYWCRMVTHRLGKIPDIRFCPGPRCGQALVVDLDDKCLNVSCPLCELKFCRDCQNEWHHEIGDGSCIDFVKHQLRTIHGEEEVDKEMQHWKYSQRTGRKRCPSCRVMIEKNQGCQHMTCKKCTHQFYWCCGGDYTGPRKGCICKNKADKQATPYLEGKRFDDIFAMSKAIEVV